MNDDELTRDNEAAWQRLEQASGLPRIRWALQDPDAMALLADPGVRAAHDAVMRSIRDAVTRTDAQVDQRLAELARLRAMLDEEPEAAE